MKVCWRSQLRPLSLRFFSGTFLLFAAQAQAQALTRIGIPLVGVVDVLLKPNAFIEHRIAVEGAVRCTHQYYCTLSVPFDKYTMDAPIKSSRILKLDIHKFDIDTRRSFQTNCRSVACLNIISGTLIAKTFMGFAAYKISALSNPCKKQVRLAG